MGRITGVCLMILGVACTTAFTSIIAGRIMARSGEQKQQNPHVAAVQRQLPENAPPETALDRRWQSFPLVRRVRARFAPFLRAEEKLTELIKEESKKKEEGE